MNNQGQAPAGQKEDYGDKAAAFINKNTGGHVKDKKMMEKITDGLRSAYEKATGKKVNPKYSN
ncbi:hypothetical protein EPUS_01209 [Endocarpon pusillum Z07020]|uniref:Uncharacterized protein n=1 Tax=Endocarpon pusillum (strain Z07020 / HMAS-L-300199) TaxID=1263415 RepID=U1GTU3_ENDPU|nr:uncharacterized protein EPUS_01209 [Endocarpon pusillum Z07020]ERF75843.1 hypothetical protein EPUS_01209 [Endocarpon pusillum Z07020]